VGYVVDKVALGQVALSPSVSPVSMIPSLFYIYSNIIWGMVKGPVTEPFPQRYSLTPSQQQQMLLSFTLRCCQIPLQPSRKVSPYRLSVAAYSINLQLSSMKAVLSSRCLRTRYDVVTRDPLKSVYYFRIQYIHYL
jgi:hypothetical protein